MPEIIVIFYNDRKWVEGHPNPFDLRCDTQIIPSGSVVVGLLRRNRDGQPEELVEKPDISLSQEQSWQAILNEARHILTI